MDRKSGLKLLRQAAEGLFRWLTGNRERAREGKSERVMVTFIPSRDHQKRASEIPLTHYSAPPERGRRAYSLYSLTSYQIQKNGNVASNKQQTRKIMS